MKPTVLPGTALLILVGNGGSPEVFATPCGLTNKSFNLTASTSSTVIPFCDDPAAAAWESKDISSLTAQCSGSGVMATESFQVWNDWFLGGEPLDVQIKIDDGRGHFLGHYEGAFILSSFKLTGTRGQKITVDVTLDNDDIVAWVDSSIPLSDSSDDALSDDLGEPLSDAPGN